MSLSSILEGVQRDLTPPDQPSFSQRRRGAFEWSDGEDARTRALPEKYG